MKRVAIFLAAAAIVISMGGVSTPLTAAQGEQLKLDPSSQWNIDYRDEECALRRNFAVEGKSATLQIMQQAPGPYFRVSLATASFGAGKGKIRVAFQPDPVLEVPDYLSVGQNGAARAVNFTDSLAANLRSNARPYIGWSEAERAAREGEIQGLTVRNGFDRDLFFQTGEMHAPMEALRSCMTNLYAGWGVDLKVQEKLSRGVRVTDVREARRLILKILPPKVLQKVAIFRIVVGVDGKPTRCRAHLIDAFPETAEKICGVFMNSVKFDPALDASGRPVTSYSTWEF